MKFMCSMAAAALVALSAATASAAVVVSLDGSSAQGGSNGAGIAFAEGYGAQTPMARAGAAPTSSPAPRRATGSRRSIRTR